MLRKTKGEKNFHINTLKHNATEVYKISRNAET